MTPVFTLINQKGGVGKTTTVINLACWAAMDGQAVLVVDADPQGNATSGLGVERHSLDACVYDVLIGDDKTVGVTVDDVLVATDIENLHLIPATIALAGADMALSTVLARERRLRTVLDSIRDDYDLILVDTPPSLGILSINSLVAADKVVIPIQCEYYALEGVSQLLGIINRVQESTEP